MENRSAPRFEGAGPVLVRVPLAPMPSGGSGGSDGPAQVAAAPALLRARVESLVGDPLLREGVALASPSVALSCRQDLAGLSDKRLRTLAASLTAYSTRMRTRATPFGVFAGVALAGVADASRGRVGAAENHRRLVRPDAALLDAFVEQVECSDEGLRALDFVANPCVQRQGQGFLLLTPDARVSRAVLPAHPAVAAVLAAAEQPAGGSLLLDRARQQGESDERARALLRTLVKRRFLLSDLRPAAHEADPLGHVLGRLGSHRLRPDLAGLLERFDTALHAYARQPVGRAAAALEQAQQAAAAVLRGVGLDPDRQEGGLLHVDTVLDADIALGAEVAEEAGRAAAVLARFARYPDRRRLQRELEQASGGFAVPLLDVPCPPAPPADRLRATPPRLLAAYAAALREGRPEIELDDELLDAVAPEAEADEVTELDLFAVVAAPDAAALDRGRFELHIRRPATTSAGTSLARFVPALGAAGAAALAAVQRRTDQVLADAVDASAVSADVSFRPRQPGAENTARAALNRSARIVTNAPFAAGSGGREIGVQDLLLLPGADGPQVWSRSLGVRVLPRATTALNTETTAPRSAHLLAVASGQNCALRFDWGALADSPWLPRIRRGRTVFAPQTWRPDQELCGEGAAEEAAWRRRFARWCGRWGVPDVVTLVDGDRQMPLRLDDPVDLESLRRHAQRGALVLVESFGQEHCWVASPQGSHLLEAVFPLVRQVSAQAPADAGHGAELPPRRPIPVRPVPPGGEWVRARLACAPGRERLLLPALAGELAGREWFFTRPEPGGLTVCVRTEDRPEALRTCLAGLSAALAATGSAQDVDALAVLGYARDAGFGVPLPLPELAERWAVADTRRALAAAAADPGGRTAAVLGSVALAGAVADACGRSPLADVAPDRPGFALLRRELMPRLVAEPRAEPAGAESTEAVAAQGLARSYVSGQQDRGTAVLVGGLLLRQHASRLVGAEQTPGLLALASAARLAAESFHRAQRRSA